MVLRIPGEGAVLGLSAALRAFTLPQKKEQRKDADGIGDRWEKPSPRHRGFRGRLIYTSPRR